MIKVEDLKYLTIGQQGENQLILEIDMNSWLNEIEADGLDNDDVVCFILYQPFGADVPAPIVTTTWDRTTGILTWEISASATEIEGQGYMEIRMLENYSGDPEDYDGLIKKSRVIPTVVNHSISGISTSAIPLTQRDWVNYILTVRNQLETMFNGAVTTYAFSESYTTVPTTGWSETIEDLLEHVTEYLWTRITFEWSTGAESTIEFPVYIAGVEGTEVFSVNGKVGNVVLDGDDILCAPATGSEEVTINTRFAGIDTNLSLRKNVRFADVTLSLQTVGGAQTAGYQVQDVSANQIYFGYGIYNASPNPNVLDLHDQNFVSATIVAVNGASSPAGDYGLVFGAPVVKLRTYTEGGSPLTDLTTITVPFSDVTLVAGPRTYPETITVRVAYYGGLI